MCITENYDAQRIKRMIFASDFAEEHELIELTMFFQYLHAQSLVILRMMDSANAPQ